MYTESAWTKGLGKRRKTPQTFGVIVQNVLRKIILKKM